MPHVPAARRIVSHAAATVALCAAMVLLPIASAVAVPSIQGVVTDEWLQTPVAGIEADAWVFDAAEGHWVIWDWAFTGADGTYTLNDLPDGVYRIGFFDPELAYVEEFYLAAPSVDLALDVSVPVEPAGRTIDASLTPRLSLAGRVTAAGTGAALPDATVTLWSFDGTTWSETAFQTRTTASGDYRFGAVPDGVWRVQATDPRGRFDSVFYSAAASVDAATDVSTLAEGEPNRAVDIALHDETQPPTVQADIAERYVGVASFSIVATDPPHNGPLSASGVASISYRIDQEDTRTVDASTAMVTVDGAGAHSIAYSARDIAGNESASITDTFTVLPGSAVRVSGPDRYETAVAVARQRGWSGVTSIVLASGEDRALADPLSAAGLCWALNDAPLLLTRAAAVPDPVEQAVAEAVRTNGSVTLVAVGGRVTVPDARLGEVRAGVARLLGLSAAQAASAVRFDRVSGEDRYAVAAAVARRMKQERPSGFGRYALVANGSDPGRFFDALALSAVSARSGAPILLVRATSVPGPTSNALTTLGIARSHILVAGGSASVSRGVVNTLGASEAQRLAGADRYTTSVAVADRALSLGLLQEGRVGVVAKVPDALAGGVFAGSRGAPLLVTASDSLSAAPAAWLRARRGSLTECWALGGPSSLSPSVLAQIDASIR